MKYLLIAAVLLLPVTAFARSEGDRHVPDYAPSDAPVLPSNQQRDANIYAKGYCDGLQAAIKASQDNRDKWRHMMESIAPFEARDAAMKRLSEPGAKPTVLDSVDMYVVLPEVPFKMVGITLPDGNVVVCQPDETKK